MAEASFSTFVFLFLGATVICETCQDHGVINALYIMAFEWSNIEKTQQWFQLLSASHHPPGKQNISQMQPGQLITNRCCILFENSGHGDFPDKKGGCITW